MKDLQITETFDGYPNDKKRSFVAGEEVSLPAAYADILIAKKHAKEAPAAKAEPTSTKVAEKLAASTDRSK